MYDIFQRVALHGCHLTKRGLPETPTSFLIITITCIDTFVILQQKYNKTIVEIKLNKLLVLTKCVLLVQLLATSDNEPRSLNHLEYQ